MEVDRHTISGIGSLPILYRYINIVYNTFLLIHRGTGDRHSDFFDVHRAVIYNVHITHTYTHLHITHTHTRARVDNSYNNNSSPRESSNVDNYSCVSCVYGRLLYNTSCYVIREYTH